MKPFLLMLFVGSLASAEPIPWGICQPLGGLPHPKLIGAIRGHRVYDAAQFKGGHIYSVPEMNRGRLSGHALPPQTWTRWVYVERSPDEFCAIYKFSLAKGDEFFGMLDHSASYIVHVGARAIIGAEYTVGMNHPTVTGEYFTLLADGSPYRLDFGELAQRASAKILPKDLSIRTQKGIDVKAMTYSEPVYKPADAMCCPSGGSVLVNFGFSGDKLIVTRRLYDPSRQ